MRQILLLFGIAGMISAQSLTEFGAAAAGGTTGTVAGKKVSDGITSIFGKVSKQTSTAAGESEKTLEIGPGVPNPPRKASRPEREEHGSDRGSERGPDHSMVPPPPPLAHAALRKPPQHREPPREPVEPVVPVTPPPHVVRAEDLKNLALGTSREDVLKAAPPASRVTMFEGGHLLEIFHYASNDSNIGEVRLSDGTVASVELQ